MRDTPERDLAVANELGRMADAKIRALEAERDALDHALRLVLSRAQVDRMMELQRQGFTGTIYEAWDKGLMPEEYRPAWELLKQPALGETK